MGSLATIATCSLNQWALDFDGNLERITESIITAKKSGAKLRVGPELEITGYGCYDHFYERDTVDHSWEALAKILENKDCHDIICCIGMPVYHKASLYNCSIIIYNSKILLIRPKIHLANSGNYREFRYFTPWVSRSTETYTSLPPHIRQITGQSVVTFGDAVISTKDTVIGIEICEELFKKERAPNNEMYSDGVEIICNPSGSHHELRKLNERVCLVENATSKSGIYLYSNQQGCDGDRVYYDGCALIAVNGKVVAQGTQFSLLDVEVIASTIDLEEIRSKREQGTQIPKKYHRVQIDITLCGSGKLYHHTPRETMYHTPEEEIALGPACWMWDYLRRSQAAGFFVPLSGGIDSCATAIITFSMCRLVVEAAKQGNEQVISDARRIIGESEESNYIPIDASEFCNKIFYTCYMGTQNSSKSTRDRAIKLSKAIGSCHIDLNMDTIVTSIISLFTKVTSCIPKFKVHGGTSIENTALQNIQARLRMVLSYLFAQLLPWSRGKKGSLLVLGSANVDESLRGYFTKYDCSSADINPIGSFSKNDLKRFIAYAQCSFELPVLYEFLEATPTAELEPTTGVYMQSDEEDMGMTYEELSVFGKLRKIEACGPYSMYKKLEDAWNSMLSPKEIATKVKMFFYHYAINRHKMTTITPAYHAETYSPDDNRFDTRPFLYQTSFSWQFRKIDNATN